MVCREGQIRALTLPTRFRFRRLGAIVPLENSDGGDDRALRLGLCERF
jgi:hypothetical protein